LPRRQLAGVQTNGGGVHDLVGPLVLEHAILVDASLVRKSIGADDCLVGLDHHAGVAADHIAGPVDLLGQDVGVQVVGLRPHMQRHHGLFQAGVASPLADPV
jgi:hypothetical protein